MNLDFTGNNFKHQRKYNNLPSHRIEDLRSTSAYHNRYTNTFKPPKIYNANSFIMKPLDFNSKFTKYKFSNNFDLVKIIR